MHHFDTSSSNQSKEVMMKCKDCKHYNGATMPGAGLCNATQARTFATTVCFNGLFTPKKRQDEPDSKTGKK